MSDIEVSRDGAVATIWLNRPEKRNAMTYPMWVALAERCTELADDPTVRVLVVRGTGDHFCAGADIAGFATSGSDGVDAATVRDANEAADAALAAFPKPSIAVISGSCVGGGAGIAAACDLRFADTTARFGITPARLGLVYPTADIERITHLIGPAAAKHLLFSAELIDAERALRIGFVDELHAPGDLDARAVEFTRLLAAERSLLTQMASKELVDAATAGGTIPAEVASRWHAALESSDDPAEGVRAFLERRPPHFTWTP